jgi:CRISPR-associated protein Cas2
VYVIIAYDIVVERLDKVRHVLKQYLNWIQNSAFEDEISAGKLEELRLKIFDLIDVEQDSIVVFSSSNPTWISKIIWGREKAATDSIL